MHLAHVLQSKRISQADHAFIVAACDLQMRRDFCPAWGLEPWPCSPFSGLSGLKAADYHPVFGQDNIGTPDALGFHDDQAGYIYSRWMVSRDPIDGTTPSHEDLEMRGDPDCNQWWRMPDGRETASEACDAVEGDSYPIEVSIAGHSRKIMVSNFVLPAWWTPGAPGPYDFLGKLKAPFTMTAGGYMIIRDRGHIVNIFADDLEHLAALDPEHRDHHQAMARARRAHVGLKLGDPMSRTARRHATIG